MSHPAIGGAALAVSMAAHAWLLVTSGHGHAAARRPRPPTFVSLMAVAPEPAVAPKPAPPPPPEPAAPPPALRPRLPQANPAAARSEPAPPAPDDGPSAGPAPELTGRTLSAAIESTESWSAPAGNGSSRQGLVQAGAAGSGALDSPKSGRAPEATRAARLLRQPDALPLSQLSRKPNPPSLTAALERNYPPAARRIGRSGDASVRARVEANGNVGSVSIVTETSNGFGDACRRTLLASHWSAPLDRGGKPVATWITYRCRFRIDG